MLAARQDCGPRSESQGYAVRTVNRAAAAESRGSEGGGAGGSEGGGTGCGRRRRGGAGRREWDKRKD